jgi:hypothetical protein
MVHLARKQVDMVLSPFLVEFLKEYGLFAIPVDGSVVDGASAGLNGEGMYVRFRRVFAFKQ